MIEGFTKLQNWQVRIEAHNTLTGKEKNLAKLAVNVFDVSSQTWPGLRLGHFVHLEAALTIGVALFAIVGAACWLIARWRSKLGF